MLSVQNVSKSFGRINALRGVSFQVERGEIIGVLGPNGAGKTTLMRLMTGFFPPTSGRVMLGGVNVARPGSPARKKIGYLPENNPLYRDMSVREFLNYVAKLKGIPFWERKRGVNEALDLCGVETVQNRIITRLSKGFQQRIGLAQALLGNPEFLILDEPTSGLDPEQIIEIRTLIQRLGKERTIILSTHILPEVRLTCGRILILNEGRLVATGTPEELEESVRSADELEITIRGDLEKINRVFANLQGVQKVTMVRETGDEREYLMIVDRSRDLRSHLASAVLGAGLELLSLKHARKGLEEVFLKIVKRDD